MRPTTIALIVLIIIAAIWLVMVHPSRQAPVTSVPSAKPLAVKPEHVQAAEKFLQAWSRQDTAAVYDMLSSRMKTLITQEQYAAQMAEMKLSNPEIVAQIGLADAAFVIARLTVTQAAGSPPLEGASILLRLEQRQWKVALLVTMDKVSKTYADLKLAPGKDKGYVVTYQDEKGQVSTTTLPEL